MERREEESLGGIVKAFAAGSVCGQVVAGVDVDIKKVTDSGGVLVAVEAADPRGRGLDAIGAGGMLERGVDPGRKLLAGGIGDPGCTRRWHGAFGDSGLDALPGARRSE